MQIRWNNIITVILAMVILIAGVSHWPQITVAVTSPRYIGPGHSIEDKTTGLVMIGLIGTVLVAIIRILTSQRK